MDRRGAWSQMGTAAPEGVGALRGRWLVTSQNRTDDASPGFPVRIMRTEQIYTVLDVVSRKAVCRYRWSTWRYDGKRGGSCPTKEPAVTRGEPGIGPVDRRSIHQGRGRAGCPRSQGQQVPLPGGAARIERQRGNASRF